MSSSAQIVAVGCVNAIEEMRGGSEDEMTERECERHVEQLRRVNEQLRAENAALKKMQARVREALGLPPYAEKVIPER